MRRQLPSTRPTERSACDLCTWEQACCKAEPAFLSSKDIDGIARATGLSPADFTEESEADEIRVTVLRFNETGSCMFFDERSKKCGIYEARPADCRLFPLDMDLSDSGLCWIRYPICGMAQVPFAQAVAHAVAEVLPVLGDRDILAFASMPSTIADRYELSAIERMPLIPSKDNDRRERSETRVRSVLSPAP